MERRERHRRLRRKIMGTAERPRLSVFRGHANMTAQLIDDVKGASLVFVSTSQPNLKKTIGRGGNIKAAERLGEIVAEQAKKKGIAKAVFDRGGYPYHGRIKALADAARKGGLVF